MKLKDDSTHRKISPKLAQAINRFLYIPLALNSTLNSGYILRPIHDSLKMTVTSDRMTSILVTAISFLVSVDDESFLQAALCHSLTTVMTVAINTTKGHPKAMINP